MQPAVAQPGGAAHTGLGDFGPDNYTDGLAVLLSSCARDVDARFSGLAAELR